MCTDEPFEHAAFYSTVRQQQNTFECKMHTFHPVDHLARWPPAYRFHDQSHGGSFCRRCQTKVRKKRFSTLHKLSRRFLPDFHPLHVYPANSAVVLEKWSVGGLSSSKHCSAFLCTSLCESCQKSVRFLLVSREGLSSFLSYLFALRCLFSFHCSSHISSRGRKQRWIHAAVCLVSSCYQ